MIKHVFSFSLQREATISDTTKTWTERMMEPIQRYVSSLINQQSLSFLFAFERNQATAKRQNSMHCEHKKLPEPRKLVSD